MSETVKPLSEDEIEALRAEGHNETTTNPRCIICRLLATLAAANGDMVHAPDCDWNRCEGDCLPTNAAQGTETAE